MMALLNVLLPHLLSLYKKYRDEHPEEQGMTDEQMSELARASWANVQARADAFLAQ